MKRVFVDTGGFLGLLVADDVSHTRAVELFATANAERWQLLTTNAVVFETYGVLLIRSRDKRRAGMTFLDLVATGTCRIEQIRRADEAPSGLHPAEPRRQDLLLLRRLELRRYGEAGHHRSYRLRPALP